MVACRSLSRSIARGYRSIEYQIAGERMSGIMKHTLVPLGTLVILLAVATPGWCERIWDAELKRFLTEQEMSMAEVFMTEDEALKTMFSKSERVHRESLKLSVEKKS